MDVKVCIVGAGPAGLMAALHAAAGPRPTGVIEANAAAGHKLLLTGGGRCNFTHAAAPEQIAQAFGKPGRFLRPSLYEFSPDNIREFFRGHGLAETVEPDGCVFPARRNAIDIRDILVEEAQKLGVQFRYRSRAKSLAVENKGFRIEIPGQPLLASRVILATGGVSWPQTGSRGDGYRFAEQLGHTVIAPKPALVPLITREAWPRELAGVPLPKVRIWTTTPSHRCTVAGPMLFTQTGLGGPAVLDLSRLLADDLTGDDTGVGIALDVLPTRDESQLNEWLRQQCQAYPKKAVANLLSEFVPRQFARTICRLAELDADAQAGQLATEKRRRLMDTLKKLPLCVVGTEPIAKAIVTRGGVSRDEIDPRTMESRLHPGLFFAGEVIDLDGPCGGYNLQMCWSTGAAAGRAAARSLQDKSAST